MITYFTESPQVGRAYRFACVIEDGAFSGKKYTAVCQRLAKRERGHEYWEFVRTDTEESFVTAVEVNKR